MGHRMNSLRSLIWSEKGAILTEYAFLVSLIAAVCFVAVSALGANLGDLYSQTCNAVSRALGGSGC